MRISDWSSDVCSSDLFPGWTSHATSNVGSSTTCLRLSNAIDVVDAVKEDPADCGHSGIGFGGLSRRTEAKEHAHMEIVAEPADEMVGTGLAVRSAASHVGKECVRASTTRREPKN